MLYYKKIGEGPSLIILHGLFGSGDNWRSFAGSLKDSYQVILPDLSNHGRSPWSSDISYKLMAKDIIQLMDHEQIEKTYLIGHSMGGKVAMQLSHEYSARIEKLGVIDIGPWAYPPGHTQIFDAVSALDVDQLRSRADADRALQSHISDTGVRQFILKNLGRNTQGGYVWKANFALLHQFYDQIISGLDITRIAIPTLFVCGQQSNYVTNDDHSRIAELFTQSTIQHLDTGHWVHAERPMELRALINDFMI
jgi:Predicted hydrolases or acyltransferases (alpha/beta hydrolase superfamily)